MRMPGEQDDRGMGLPLIYMIAGVSIFVLIILGVVIANNESRLKKKNNDNYAAAETAAGDNAAAENNAGNPGSVAVGNTLAGNSSGGEVNTASGDTNGSANGDVTGGLEDVSDLMADNAVGGNTSAGSAFAGDAIDRLYQDNKLRVDDLDFWNMYPQEDAAALEEADVAPEEPVATPTPAPLDPSEDGKHTLVERRDGTSEWVKINPYITRNTYDPLNFIMKKDRMGYYEGEKQVSFFGVDISRQNGKVNFSGLKGAGADFVMLRLGARGYEGGLISLDENFETNLTGALEAGLEIGVYFFSQAVSVEEAAAEAAFVVEHLAGRRIAYPVVFDMEFIANDTSRIEELNKNAKTEITAAFLSAIQAAGYTPMIYGNKEWLIEQIDLTKLMSYDIWLSQQTDLPDYPYKFQMWQYSLDGKIAGIADTVDFNISFVDYAAR